MTIPNDLPEDQREYYVDYTARGGLDGLARLYAKACAGMDVARKRRDELLSKPALNGVGVQELNAVTGLINAESKIAFLLLDQLPVGTETRPTSDDPYGFFAGDDPDGRFKR